MTDNLRSDHAILLRTDFTDDSVWEKVLNIISTPSEDYGFVAYVNPINDPQHNSKTIEEIILTLPKDYDYTFILVFDHLTVSGKDNTLLCIDLDEKPHRSFRLIPTCAAGIENNLSISNMDFEEFLSYVDSDNVFRGF